MTAANPLLSVKDLAYHAPDGRPLVAGLSYDLMPGDIVAITGPNGTGKSTLLKIIMGELKAARGSVTFANKSVGYLSQLHNREFHIPLSLADVLSLGVPGRFHPAAATGLVLLTLSELNLAWNTASGGERQKTLLTQVLMPQPQVLILDEPMNHLDSVTRAKLYPVLREFVATGKRAILMVCHEKLITSEKLRPTAIIDLSQFSSLSSDSQN